MWGIVKNWKIIASGGLIILAIIVATVLINNHETIEKQKAQLANKELMLNQVENALKNNLQQLETEREARDAADRSYQSSLERKQAKVRELSNAIQESKTNDKTFKQCMEYPLSDSVYDSLFKPAKNSD